MMNQTAERSKPTILIVDNKVFSREFIQNQIWRDSQLYQYRRTVDVHVQRLRKKLETEIENPRYIVTVSGVGYKFQAA